MYSDWRYTKYTGFYHSRTFNYIKRTNTKRPKIYESMEPPRKSDGKDFFAANFDIEKYNDIKELLHLAHLAYYRHSYHFRTPSEFYYFAVLFLIPKVDSEPDNHSALWEIANHKEIRGQLLILKNEYEKQTSYNVKHFLSFGSLSCKHFCKEEKELYDMIYEKTIAGNIRFIYLQKGTDFRNVGHVYQIPKDILEKTEEHDYSDVYSGYPETDFVDLSFKQKVTVYDHLKRAKAVSERKKPNVIIKNIFRKFPGHAFEIRLAEIIISLILSVFLSYPYLRIYRYPSTMYLKHFDNIMKEFIFKDVMFYVLAFIVFLLVNSVLARTKILPSAAFSKECIVYGPSRCNSDKTDDDRMWNNFEIAYEDMYIYNYSSIVEYGTFRRFGRKYFYFSKKHLTDEEFNRFRSRLILADENTCAMLYNEKILDVAKMIKPMK